MDEAEPKTKTGGNESLPRNGHSNPQLACSPAATFSNLSTSTPGKDTVGKAMDEAEPRTKAGGNESPPINGH